MQVMEDIDVDHVWKEEVVDFLHYAQQVTLCKVRPLQRNIDVRTIAVVTARS